MLKYDAVLDLVVTRRFLELEFVDDSLGGASTSNLELEKVMAAVQERAMKQLKTETNQPPPLAEAVKTLLASQLLRTQQKQPAVP